MKRQSAERIVEDQLSFFNGCSGSKLLSKLYYDQSKPKEDADGFYRLVLCAAEYGNKNDKRHRKGNKA